MSETRRDFLADVGRGMLVAGLGAPLAYELGLAPALAGDEPAAPPSATSNRLSPSCKKRRRTSSCRPPSKS